MTEEDCVVLQHQYTEEFIGDSNLYPDEEDQDLVAHEIMANFTLGGINYGARQ